MIKTPTGTYSLADLRVKAGAFAYKNNKLWFDEDDILNDLVMFLLEGDTLVVALRKIGRKYKDHFLCVNIDNLSDKYLIDKSYEEENVRTLFGLEKTALQEEYYRRLAKLDKLSHDILVHKSLGQSDKAIAKLVGLSHSNVRVRLHRAISQMRGMK